MVISEDRMELTTSFSEIGSRDREFQAGPICSPFMSCSMGRVIMVNASVFGCQGIRYGIRYGFGAISRIMIFVAIDSSCNIYNDETHF
jgi:hypothetical protein